MRNRRKPKKSAISKKIAILIREGKDPKEAAGAAYGMAREGRLTRMGGYIRGSRKKKRGGKR